MLQHVGVFLLILNAHPGVTMYHTLMILSTINAEEIIMPYAQFKSIYRNLIPHFDIAMRKRLGPYLIVHFELHPTLDNARV